MQRFRVTAESDTFLPCLEQGVWFVAGNKHAPQTGHNACRVQGSPDNHVFHHNLLVQAAASGAQAATSYKFTAIWIEVHTTHTSHTTFDESISVTMLLERVLSKLTSFATYSDVAKPTSTLALEEDSDTSVFSEDEEYEEVRFILLVDFRRVVANLLFVS